MKLYAKLTLFFALLSAAISISSYAMEPPPAREKRGKKRPLTEAGLSQTADCDEEYFQFSQPQSFEQDEKQDSPQYSQWEQCVYTQFFNTLTQANSQVDEKTQRETYSELLAEKNAPVRESLSRSISRAVEDLIESGSLPKRAHRERNVRLEHKSNSGEDSVYFIKDGDMIFFGRSKSFCDIAVFVPKKNEHGYLAAASISRVHLIILRKHGYLLVFDPGSLSGTTITKTNKKGRLQIKKLKSHKSTTLQVDIFDDDQEAVLESVKERLFLNPRKKDRQRKKPRLHLVEASQSAT